MAKFERAAGLSLKRTAVLMSASARHPKPLMWPGRTDVWARSFEVGLWVSCEDYPGRRPVRRPGAGLWALSFGVLRSSLGLLRTEASFLEAIGRVAPLRLLLATGLRFRCDLQATPL